MKYNRYYIYENSYGSETFVDIQFAREMTKCLILPFSPILFIRMISKRRKNNTNVKGDKLRLPKSLACECEYKLSKKYLNGQQFLNI